MRAVVQRVSRASVASEGVPAREIGTGLLVLLGIKEGDGPREAAWMARKVAGLRIFPDAYGKMNRSVIDADGGVLVVSQFTLYGDVRKGKRPSFVQAARPEIANDVYETMVSRLTEEGVASVETGTFQALMDVTLTNHGPVTLIIDTEGVNL